MKTRENEIQEKIQKVYEFVLRYVNENGFPPSIRDICANLNIKSTATAYSDLNKLKSKGLLDKLPNKKRAITIQDGLKSYKNIPLLGTIRAGSPIFAVENLEGYYPLPNEFSSHENVYALRVVGNSMINAGILENDVVIVKYQNTANNGDIVVALIDEFATVKRFYKKENKIILRPENDDMDDMIFDDVSIIGVVIGLFRKF